MISRLLTPEQIAAYLRERPAQNDNAPRPRPEPSAAVPPKGASA